MSGRIIQHLLFWLCFSLLYAVSKIFFAAASDMQYPLFIRFVRYWFNELAFLPWKVIPFYFLFYFLIPRYFKSRQYFKLIFYFLIIIVLSLIGYRSMVSPMSNLLYGESPSFNVFAISRFIYSLTEILPALGLASAIKLLKKSIEHEKRTSAIQKEKINTELKYLKAQTNPHFLFNTLNNIYSQVRKNDPQAEDSIVKLSGLIRFILKECHQDKIPLEKEIKVLEDYIALEHLRYGNRLELFFDVKMKNPQQVIAPLSLLPFVENAFKHGASESRSNPKIQIELDADGTDLFFKISNQKIEDIETKGLGIGLKNIRRQLELIYGKNHRLEVIQKDNLYSVELRIKKTHEF